MPAGATGQRPYVLLSAAMSADGYIDDASARRLVLSGPEDLDRVDAVRAGCDAIMVGAGTIRADNPRLLVRDPHRRDERRRRGLPPSPVKVTITASGELDPRALFFAADGTGKLVYASASGAGRLRQRLGDSATVIALREGTGLPAALADLAARGVARLMIEGGSWLLGQALSAGLADELQLAVAPVFVADPAAPRLLSGAAVPGRMQPELGTTSAASGPAVPCRMQPELGTTSAASGPAVPGRMRLIGLERAGDVAVLRYLAGGQPDG